MTTPSPKRLCDDIEKAQSLYADLFLRIERELELDPLEDGSEIEQAGAQIAEHALAIEGHLTRLRPQLEEWRGDPSRFPEDVNEFVNKFLTLLETGLSEALKGVRERTKTVAQRRSQLQAALSTMSQQRHGIRGYRTQAHPSPQVIDSEI